MKPACKIGFYLFISILFFSSCKKGVKYYESSGEIFKTSFHIKYKYHRALDVHIKDCLNRFDLSLNPFNNKSIIYKVNNNQPVEVDDWFTAVFNKAMEISEISGGLYDITCAPFINLWGFGYSKTDSVNQTTIDSLKQFVGYGKVRLAGRKVIKDDPRLQLNASSIAKGYSCDVIAKLLESYGITDYLVEIGGEIHAKGRNDKGVCWKIEIPKPVDNSSGSMNERMDVMELCDRSIATSGNYRNYYIKDGKKYGHTINPLTGYPADSNILSVSVIYFDCMTADALATAFMTMYLDKAISLARQFPEMECIFIYVDSEENLKEYKLLYSPV
ncbi:MAG: FAD:protein FMN transferase [Dysgonamonadaceae bacterium]|jgi:thiamine biosynthesis lipoprotein|nr:FAD:protein FMN transferase [Dysgonamonadaceae bacterium]